MNTKQPTFTTKELNDLVTGGNDFAVQIATQLLTAEATIKDISELPDKWRSQYLTEKICASDLEAIINGENHDYNQMS